MALKIRLARAGAKKRPYYRIVVADARNPRDGRFIEKVGSYNPMLERDDEHRVQLNTERVQHWLGVGAQPTDRVARFLGEAGLAPKFVLREQTKKSQPKAKALERMKEAEEAKKAAEEAAAAPAEADEAPAEAPAEDAGADEAAEAEATA